MEKERLFRVAAIVYADESQVLNPKIVHKKIVQSVFVNNSNKRLSISSLIDIIKGEYGLDFIEEEILEIIKKDNTESFDTVRNTKNKIPEICLTSKRYKFLLEKSEEQNIKSKINYFFKNVYKGDLKFEPVEKAIYKFLYELLNKNIDAFKKLTSSNCKMDDIIIDYSSFPTFERNAVNEFLKWDDNEKNKAIYALVSYSLEYSVVSNKIKSADFLANSIKNKIFYLDNNIIYRAIGINGENRQKRTKTFLNKCKESGSKLYISKYTVKEFNETIDYHISLLQRVPFKKIDPYLFAKYAVNPSIYEFYHKWRKDRTAYHFKLFRAHLQDLYHKFLSEFDVIEDYKINFDERNEENIKTIESYKVEIRNFKVQGREENIYFDALNTFLVEKKRGDNNKHITDTKFYFISADKRLRNWDFARNDCQPIALLPSQWMVILLKFFTRTNDDYRSFVSFLGLPTEEPIVPEDQLHIILAGISEITEDFEKQGIILEDMINNNLKSILEGKDIYEVEERAYTFAKDTFDKEFKNVQKGYEKEIERVRQDSLAENLQYQIRHKHELLGELENQIASLTRIKDPLDKKINKYSKLYKILFWALVIVYYGALMTLTIIFSWGVMEPVIYFLSLAWLLIYINRYGKSFSLKKHFAYIKNKICDWIYRKHNFESSELYHLNERKDELIEELSVLRVK